MSRSAVALARVPVLLALGCKYHECIWALRWNKKSTIIHGLPANGMLCMSTTNRHNNKMPISAVQNRIRTLTNQRTSLLNSGDEDPPNAQAHWRRRSFPISNACLDLGEIDEPAWRSLSEQMLGGEEFAGQE